MKMKIYWYRLCVIKKKKTKYKNQNQTEMGVFTYLNFIKLLNLTNGIWNCLSDWEISGNLFIDNSPDMTRYTSVNVGIQICGSS